MESLVEAALDHFRVLSGREYATARYRERMRFLSAIEHVAPSVLRALDNKPAEAYRQLVDEYRQTYVARQPKPLARARPGQPFRVPPTPEPYDPPKPGSYELDTTTNPSARAFGVELRAWAAKANLNADWMIEAGRQTVIAWEFIYWELPEHVFHFAPPMHLQYLLTQYDVRGGGRPMIEYPVIAREIDESFEAHQKRQTQEQRTWARNRGYDARWLKSAKKDWHYEALALRLARGYSMDELVAEFGRDWQTIEPGMRGAAEIIGLPYPT